MGEDVSWMAFRGIPKQEVLARLSLRDTGEPGDGGIEEFAGAELPDGWYLILSSENDFMMANTEVLSAGCRVVVFATVETMGTSWAQCHEDGRQVWHLYHDPQKLVEVDGTPPAAFDAIRAKYEKRQEEAGPHAHVDYLFDVPVETAKAECGYRYDDWEDGGEEPDFTILEATYEETDEET